MAFGVLFSFGVFLTPIARSFDTTTGPVAPLFSGAVLSYYLAGAFGGWFGDRFGIRPVVAVGAVSLSSGLALTALADHLWQAYLAFVPLVGLGVGCCYAPLIGTVGRWFGRRRTLAIAVLLVGVSAGTLVAPLAGRALTEAFGWRRTFVGFAALALVVIGVAAAIATDPPATAPTEAGTLSLRSLLTRRLVGLYASVVMLAPGFYAPFAFFNDYALDVGIGGPQAAGLVGVMGAASLAARLGFGVGGDRLGPFGLYRLGYGLMTLSLLVWLMAGSSYGLLVVAAVSHGVGWAAWVTATPVVLAAWFGTRSLGGIVGGFYTGLGIGALLGPAVSGFIIDRAGFRPAVAVVALTTTVAFGIALVSTTGGGLSFANE